MPPPRAGLATSGATLAPSAAPRALTQQLPTQTSLEVAGLSLMNTFMSGPSQPTQTDKVQRPDAALLQAGVPVTESDLVHLVQEHAAAVERAAGLAGAAALAGPHEEAGKRKGLLRRAGRALSKMGRHVGSRALGTMQPPAPTLESVVAVGRNKAVARNPRVMPADDSVSQHTVDWRARTRALQKARGEAVVELGAGLHQARAAQASADVVTQLHRHAQGKQEERLDGLVEHVTRDTGLHDEWLGAIQRHAQAEWAVVENMQGLGGAHRAHGRMMAEDSQLRRSARLAELRQQACLDALRAPGRGESQAVDAGPALPLQQQVAQARQKLDDLEQALRQFEQRRAEALVQANAGWALHRLGPAEPAGGRPSEQALAREVCLRELAEAEDQLQGLTERRPPLPAWAEARVAPDVAAASARVEALKRWRDELAEDDLAARARSELSRLAGTAPADSLNRVAQEEPSCRQAWEATAAQLAQLEVQQLRAHGTRPAGRDPRQHAASSSGSALAAAAAEARVLGQHAQKWGVELGGHPQRPGRYPAGACGCQGGLAKTGKCPGVRGGRLAAHPCRRPGGRSRVAAAQGKTVAGGRPRCRRPTSRSRPWPGSPGAWRCWMEKWKACSSRSGTSTRRCLPRKVAPWQPRLPIRPASAPPVPPRS